MLEDKKKILPYKKNFKDLPQEEKIKFLWPYRFFPYSPYKLHFEILDFFHFISPMPFEEEMRRKVFDKLKTSLDKHFPYLKLKTFGSFRTGLYLPSSDIDVVIEGNIQPVGFDSFANMLKDEKLSAPNNINILDKTIVPLVKYIDIETKIKVDISFNNISGVRAIEFVEHQLKLFPNIAPLYLLIRQILINRGLGEVYTGGLGSYSLFLLLVSFFQRHPRRDARSLRANLGVLLIEFLELYGVNFCYETSAIMVDREGRYVFKSQLNYPYYGGSVPTLDIYDPFNDKNIVSKGTYRLLEIKELFSSYYLRLYNYIINRNYSENINKKSRGAERSILHDYVYIPKETQEFRHNLYDIYKKLILTKNNENQAEVVRDELSNNNYINDGTSGLEDTLSKVLKITDSYNRDSRSKQNEKNKKSNKKS